MEGLRAYTFASVFIAHAADGHFDDNELLTIRRNVHRAARSLGYRSQEVEAMIVETVDMYWRNLDLQGPTAMMSAFQQAVHQIRLAFSSHPATLEGIQADLLDIAGADGDVDDMEQYLVDHVAALWNEKHA